MRIALVTLVCRAVLPAHRQENLAIGHLAAIARRDGHDVDIVDAWLSGWSPAGLAREIAGRRPDLVGVSISFQELIAPAMSFIGLLRRAGYTGFVVVGGHPPTFLHAELRRDYSGFDAAVVGEGEETFSELLRVLSRGGDVTHLPGLATAGEGVVARPLVADLDTLPFPARDTLPAYLERRRGHPPTASVLRSRGCYGSCSFCDTRAFYAVSPGSAWRVRSATGVVDEIEGLVHDYAVETILFWDDNFMGPGERGRDAAESLAREMLRRRVNVRFALECRVTDVDLDLFRHLREAGLSRVFLGVEAVTERQLGFFNKKVTVEDSLRALRLIESLGLDVTIGMIMFDPYTTLTEFGANLDFLRLSLGSWGPLKNKVARVWNRLDVYAGTPLAERLRAEGRLKGSYANYGFAFADPAVGWLFGAGQVLERLASPLRWAATRLRSAGKANRYTAGRGPRP
jgi:radical SAM superfamily enzyme YgiQ (UPF0313 family)